MRQMMMQLVKQNLKSKVIIMDRFLALIMISLHRNKTISKIQQMMTVIINITTVKEITHHSIKHK